MSLGVGGRDILLYVKKEIHHENILHQCNSGQVICPLSVYVYVLHRELGIYSSLTLSQFSIQVIKSIVLIN